MKTDYRISAHDLLGLGRTFRKEIDRTQTTRDGSQHGRSLSALGLWMSFDTGLAPWHWQFWLMFAPLFLAGEMTIHLLRSR
jgi:hypothetical protein